MNLLNMFGKEEEQVEFWIELANLFFVSGREKSAEAEGRGKEEEQVKLVE